MYVFDKLASTKKESTILKLLSICLLAGIFIFLGVNLYKLQVINGNQYLRAALENTYSRQIVLAPRGIIKDRNLRTLVSNEEIYSIDIDMSKVKPNEVEEIESKIKEIKTDLSPIGKNLKDNAQDGLVEIVKNLTKEEYENLSKKLAEYPSLIFVKSSERHYIDGEVSAHLIGFVGKPDEKDIEEENISTLSIVGKDGIEKFYDNFLRGQDGEAIQIKRMDGRIDYFKTESEEKGAEVILTIDSLWQENLYKIFKLKIDKGEAFGGAGVILESNTGKILAMVSYPSFDPNLFAQGIDEAEFKTLIENTHTPLLNRAIGIQASPGSTFKPIIAVAGLDLNLINPDEYYYSAGCEMIDPTHTFCEADRKVLGNVNVYEALARSSNLYFCNVGRQFNKEFGDENGILNIIKYTDKFGIGKSTGIDLFGEAKGLMGTPEYIQKTQERQWYVGDMCNAIIGQGSVSVTPIRMAVVAASLVNQGKVMKPYIVQKIISPDGEVLYENVEEEIISLNVDQKILEIINEGMRQTVSDSQGSAGYLRGMDGNFRVKTGSADASERLIDGTIKEGAHSWVTGTFSYQNIDYSFVVFMQYGGRGYQSVPIIGDFVKCLNQNFQESCMRSYY